MKMEFIDFDVFPRNVEALYEHSYNISCQVNIEKASVY